MPRRIRRQGDCKCNRSNMNSHPKLKTLFMKSTASGAAGKGAGLVFSLLLGMVLTGTVSGQTLNLQFKFDDSGTATTDSQSGVVMNLVDTSGAAADLHGAPGSGVVGVGQALDLTASSSGGNGPLAWVSSSSAINFGSVSNFTVTMWLKPQQTISGFPRFFTLGSPSVTDVSSTGALGFSPDSGTPGQLFINGGTKIVLPGFNALFPGGKWTFLALTYDGATSVTLYTGSESSPVGTPQNLVRTVTTPMNVGTAFRLMIGNNSARSRAFDGWIDDVRFYTGTANAAFVEAVRSAATNIPNPYASSPTVLPANTVYAGTTVTLTGSNSGTPPIANTWQTDNGSGGATWVDLPNSNTNSYTIDTTALSNQTLEYRLAVTNSAGSYAGAPATLIVLPASGPIVVSNTVVTPATVAVGGSVVVSGAFKGTLPISYQWLFTDTNGVTSLVPGATNNLLTLSNVQFANAGSYSLMASNNPGGIPTVATNTAAALTVGPWSSSTDVSNLAPEASLSARLGGTAITASRTSGRAMVMILCPAFTTWPASR